MPRFPERWLPARHDRTMAELWKIDETDGKVRFFRALPWLAQSGIVRAVFRGRHPARPAWRCRSSVVEHVLGKDGVGSSILLGSTISSHCSCRKFLFHFVPGASKMCRFRVTDFPRILFRLSLICLALLHP